MPARDGSGDRHIHWIGRLLIDEHGNPQRMTGAVQDVTAHQTAQEALENARVLVRDILDIVPTGIGVLDSDGTFVIENRAFRAFRDDLYDGVTPPKNVYNRSPQRSDEIVRLAEQLAPTISGLLDGSISGVEQELRLMIGGKPRTLEVHAQRLSSRNGDLVVLAQHDISSMVEMAEAIAQNERQMRALLDNLPDIFWIYDVARGRFVYFSSAVELISKFPRERLLEQQSMHTLVHPDDRDAMQNVIAERLAGNNDSAVQYRLIDADGGLHWMSGRAIPLRNERNEVTSINGVLRDITAAKRHEDELVRAAYVDDITGLPNRKALLEHLSGRAPEVTAEPFALLLINIDRFKNINATLGYGSGDLLLAQAGERLRAMLPEAVYLSRFGGDEFAALCALADLEQVGEAARACFASQFQLNIESAYVTVSMGVARWPEDSGDAQQLLRFAAVATQRAKELGRNN